MKERSELFKENENLLKENCNFHHDPVDLLRVFVVRSSIGRAPRCERGRCGFESRRSTQISSRFHQLMQVVTTLGPWQKGVCTSLSRKTMTVRVRSAPPIHLTRLRQAAADPPQEADLMFAFNIRNISAA